MPEHSEEIKVGILPHELRYQVKLGCVPLQSLDWPGQVAPTNGTIADLSARDHVVVYPSSKRLLRGFGPLKCKIDLLMSEPLIIHGKYYKNIWLLRHKFNYILCRYQQYAARYANVIQFAVVESWVDGSQLQWPPIKTHNCSLIASEKIHLVGHKLRHAVVDWVSTVQADVHIMGRGYQPFDLKQDGLLPYHYSVVIENVPEPDCFTEKLLDCMLCGTLPIYYGPKNIGDYFNLDGIIVCCSITELQAAIATTFTPPNEIQWTAMEENRQTALRYSNLKQRVVEVIRNNDVIRNG
jgi:hypothetical protein|tara:strand:- start:589 stop:1473 length:885 start_codon:yes stop_codon:yes gene_type:complete